MYLVVALIVIVLVAPAASPLHGRSSPGSCRSPTAVTEGPTTHGSRIPPVALVPSTGLHQLELVATLAAHGRRLRTVEYPQRTELEWMPFWIGYGMENLRMLKAR